MLNEVRLIGRVGVEPETSYTQSGVAISKCSLATTEKWKDKTTGEVKENTEWHRLTFFGKVAEIVAQYVHKGSLVFVGGKMHYDSYTDREGTKRYTAEVQCDRLKLLESKKSQESHQGASPKPQTNTAPSQNASQRDEVDEDEIPF